MISAGADLCLAFHRAISASKGTKDCARQAIEAGIPTYLINSEAAEPKRLVAGDERGEVKIGVSILGSCVARIPSGRLLVLIADKLLGTEYHVEQAIYDELTS